MPLASNRRARMFRRHLAGLAQPAPAVPAPLPVSSKEEIESRLASALAATGYARLRQIEVRLDGEAVELHGVLPSYFLKQLAQETIMQSPGSPAVRNLVEVSA